MTIIANRAPERDNNTVPFSFEGTNVRTLTTDNEPWFVLGDVCKVLGIVDVGNAKKRLDLQDTRSTRLLDSRGHNRQNTVINESGLYDVILDSRKPQAKRFRRWITAEVIPSIRKTGSYTASPAELSRMDILNMAIEAETEKNAALAELEKASPKAEFYDEYVESDGQHTLNDAAKQLGWRPLIMRQELVDQKILCKGPNEAGNGYEHVPRQEFITQGYFEVKTSKFRNDYGRWVSYRQTLVTAKGIPWLAKRLGEDDGRVRNPRKKIEPNPINFNYVPSRFL